MIYDCFIFNNELDLLEIRVNELFNCIQPVTHVLVESKWTFTGNPKPSVFKENCDRFAGFPIMSIEIENSIETDNPWEREKFQRNSIKNALNLLCPSDKSTVIISDADEIPNHKSVDFFCSRNMEFAAFTQNKYNYYLNYMEGFQSWDRSRIMRYKYLKDKTPEEVRNSGYDNYIAHGGWHWSWLGGVDKIIEKFNSFSHQELNIPKYTNPEKISKKLETGHSLWSDDDSEKLKIIEIDKTFPSYIIENIAKFKHLIK